MRKMAMILLAALLLVQGALAAEYVGTGVRFALPEGFAVVEGAEFDGYRAAAEADAGAGFDGESMLALNGTKSISLASTETGAENVAGAVAAVVDAYAGYIPGFADVEPEEYDAGDGRVFVKLRFSVDGETATQAFFQHGEVLYVLTFMGMEEAEADAALAGFVIDAG